MHKKARKHTFLKMYGTIEVRNPLCQLFLFTQSFPRVLVTRSTLRLFIVKLAAVHWSWGGRIVIYLRTHISYASSCMLTGILKIIFVLRGSKNLKRDKVRSKMCITYCLTGITCIYDASWDLWWMRCVGLPTNGYAFLKVPLVNIIGKNIVYILLNSIYTRFWYEYNIIYYERFVIKI